MSGPTLLKIVLTLLENKGKSVISYTPPKLLDIDTDRFMHAEYES